MRAFAKFVSYAFHPLLVICYMLLIYMWKIPYLFAITEPVKLLAILIINTVFFPAWSIFIMKKLGMLRSLEMDEKQERIIPLIAVMIFYIWTFLVARKVLLPSGMTLFILGAVISLFICFFINIFNKISLHMAGLSGLLIAVMIQIAFFGFDFRLPLLIIIVITGVVAWARLTLAAHNFGQIRSGLLVGAVGQALAIFIYPWVN